jgi:hypothetical protein
MNATRVILPVARWIAGGAALAVASYAACIGFNWFRYGHAVPPSPPEERDPLLDRFMPVYEVAERHHVRVNAPAEVTLAAARDQDLLQSPWVRAIFKGRELILRSRPDDRPRPRALLAQMQSLGWGVLAEIPGREIVVGAVTKPWEPNVTFRALPPADFAAFHEPGYVKIVWNLRADPVGPVASIYRTETRALATDPASRARFRRYWSTFSPGIRLIRRMSLGPLKAEAELRARRTRAEPRAAEFQEMH